MGTVAKTEECSLPLKQDSHAPERSHPRRNGPAPEKPLPAAREGNKRHYRNNDPTITIEVQNQVAADGELWHNCLTRGKNASQHLIYLVVVMTGPVLVTLGFVVLSLLPFGFGALSHADLHRAFEFSGKWR